MHGSQVATRRAGNSSPRTQNRFDDSFKLRGNIWTRCMRDSLQRPGSCREGALGLIHVRFSASTLSRLRFPAPRGLSRANCDVMHQHAVPRVARTSHTAITDGVEDLAKVLIDASILLRASGLTLLARRLLVGYFSARDFMFGVYSWSLPCALCRAPRGLCRGFGHGSLSGPVPAPAEPPENSCRVQQGSFSPGRFSHVSWGPC